MKKGIYYFILEEHKLKIEQSNLDKETAYQLLQLFIGDYKPEEFKNIPASKMQGIVKNYKSYINFFINEKMIYIDNNYSIEQKITKGYKIREEKYSPVLKIESSNHNYIKERITHFNTKSNLLKRKSNERLDFMKKNFKQFLKELELDLINEDIQKIEEPNSRLFNVKSISNIENKILHFKRNKTNNRLDHNLTNITSKIKYYNYNDYISIDINNSQPYLIYYFIITILKSYNNSEINIYNHNDSKNPCNYNENQLVNMVQKDINICLETLKNIDKNELEKYGNWVTSGKFYDNFINENEITSDNYDELRKKEKSNMFCVLFSKPNSYKNKKYKFNMLFPTLNNWIDEFKNVNGYNKFSIFFQKLESYLVLDNICEKLYKEDIFNVTIHDSWIIKKEDYDKFMKIFNSTFIIKPSIKIEDFTEMRQKYNIKDDNIVKEIITSENIPHLCNKQQEIITDTMETNIKISDVLTADPVQIARDNINKLLNKHKEEIEVLKLNKITSIKDNSTEITEFTF